MTSAWDEKWRNFNSFSVQGTGGSPTGPDLGNRVCDQDIGSPGRPVSCGWRVPREPGSLSCKNKTPLGTFQRPAFFIQNVLQLCQQR